MKQFLTKIYLILTLDCEDSAKLTSDSFERNLDWSEYVATKLHRLICGKSRRLNRQLIQLNQALEEAGELPGLSDDARERMRSRLDEIQDQSS